ncbi:uncharacterized protein Tco025E_08007 [Trypanosoma conorhini]|uniref:Guanine nucleotide-binding protein subunit beta-like protein n=1 Tax=Trypanosoma conorhini TaxID=83891 RepID=A0A3R7LVQ0_9TRYP|nr:uncharacterized protein Tco025E_08007 [Trypanosoma conorhini]RNF04196.1 hypothetical protein Tco025E_08007 [Trypanosoma conorhini]
MAENDGVSCRFEVQGRISSMTYSDASNACLVSTIMNGTHIFNMDDCRGLSPRYAARLESFPHHIVGGDPIISSCFLSSDSCLAVGSSVGGIVVVSRQSRSVVRCYTFQDEAPVLSLKEVPQEPSLLLSASPVGVQVIDVERAAVRLSLTIPKPRVVGAVAATRNTLAVANYDGKVLLYDVRCGSDPLTVLAVPDQVTSIAMSPDSSAVVAGTVGGRVFVMRCLMSNVREEAFGTGKTRFPIRCVAMHHGRIAAGDISAKITLLDSGERPAPTTYWTAQSLLPHLAAAAPAITASWSASAVLLRKDSLWGGIDVARKCGISCGDAVAVTSHGGSAAKHGETPSDLFLHVYIFFFRCVFLWTICCYFPLCVRVRVCVWLERHSTPRQGVLRVCIHPQLAPPCRVELQIEARNGSGEDVHLVFTRSIPLFPSHYIFG